MNSSHSLIQTRRNFIKSSAVITGATVVGAPVVLAQETKRTFKVGVIGVGGRGSGAIQNHLEAVKYLNEKLGWKIEAKLVAIADLSAAQAKRVGQRHGVPEESCFGGAEAYKRVLETNPDIVLMAQPPAFRPLHFEAAIQAGKHVFFEKPVAVDPPGVRRVIKTGELAKEKHLCVVAGTQNRHSPERNRVAREIHEGAYGRIMAGRIGYNMGFIFTNQPLKPKGPEDLAGQGKWQLWVEMSGDHIVEQHIHNIDIVNWYLGAHPVSAGGYGWRAQRVAGNMYDFFSIDYEYPNDVYVHSMCRQIGFCWDWVGEKFTFEHPKADNFQPQTPDPYADVGYHPRNAQVSEHAHLIYAIVKEQPLNEAKNVAWSSATAILGREAAYSGKRLTWDELFEDPSKSPAWYNLQLKPAPEEFETGNLTIPQEGVVRIPGKYMPA